jgi:hypothetical protein
MDQSVKLNELEQARHRVMEGEKTLSRQREVVAKLEPRDLTRRWRVKWFGHRKKFK